MSATCPSRRPVRSALAVGLSCLLARPAVAEPLGPAVPPHLSVTPPAAAVPAPEPSPQLTWKWRTFSTAEFVATAASATAALGIFVLVTPRLKPVWTGGILFDDQARDALRFRSPEGRDASRLASDFTAFGAASVAVLVDSLAIPLARGSSDVSYQLILIDAESFAFNSLLTTTTPRLFGRARPPYAQCQKDPSFDPLCGTGATSSFWSGHTSQAFTAAGLSCAHHLHVGLYGNATADALSCAGSLTLATATGMLRITGDRHYVTDVVAGAAAGFSFGYVMPLLLHYGVPLIAEGNVTVAPSPEGFGLSVVGRF